jgi:hypothetical protein
MELMTLNSMKLKRKKGYEYMHKFKIDKEIGVFLTSKLIEKVSELTRYYFVEFSGNEEVKKAVEVNDFMVSMMTGKGFTEKDVTFLEKHQDLIYEINAYVKKIESLDNSRASKKKNKLGNKTILAQEQKEG